MSINCSLCNEKADLLFKTKDWNRKVSSETFSYWRCRSCELIFLADIPDRLGDYYGEEYYQAPSIEKLKKVAKAGSYQLDMVQKFIKTGRLLEVGPGFGIFAHQAKQAGFEVDVIEMESRCCEYLSQVVNVNVFKSDSPHEVIEAMPRHDVIASWHVIEHLPNLWDFLESAANNLVPGGILLMATPNPAAFQFKILGSLWPHVDAPRHLCLVQANLLIKLLKPMGLEPVMLSFDDKGAKSWNRFGWQRFLMNRFSNEWIQKVAFVLGYIISLPMSFWETGRGNSSAYTIIFKKSLLAA